ncbi:MAG TPA: DUF433 domain-containing protein [Bryobacteraceae bacterium]|jgi:uncharacterized protein (DUF433 family)
MSGPIQIDWSQCDFTEAIPGKQGGVPLVVGTRIPAQQIVEDYELGGEIREIAENYPSISVERLRALLDYARIHKTRPAP